MVNGFEEPEEIGRFVLAITECPKADTFIKNPFCLFLVPE